MTSQTETQIPSDRAVELRVAEHAAPRSKRRAFAAVMERYGLAFLLVAVFAYFSITVPETFPTVLNVRNVLGNQSILLIVAVASVVPLVAGQFDLSVGATTGLSSVVLVQLTGGGMGLVPAILITTALCLCIGLFSGLLVSRVGVNALITTLGMATVISGVVFNITHGLSVTEGIPSSLLNLGSALFIGLPALFWIATLACCAVWWWLRRSPSGRRMEAVGVNPEAAHLIGLRSAGLTTASFVVAAGLAALAGVLAVAYSGGSNPQLGPNYLLPALSAAFLGATAISPGRYNVPGTSIAVMFLAFSVNGLNLSGAASDVEAIFNGTALVSAVALSTLARKRGARS